MNLIDFITEMQGPLIIGAILVGTTVHQWRHRHTDKVVSSGIDMSLMPEDLGYAKKINWIRAHKPKGKMSIKKAELILRDWEKSPSIHDSVANTG